MGAGPPYPVSVQQRSKFPAEDLRLNFRAPRPLEHAAQVRVEVGARQVAAEDDPVLPQFADGRFVGAVPRSHSPRSRSTRSGGPDRAGPELPVAAQVRHQEAALGVAPRQLRHVRGQALPPAGSPSPSARCAR